MYPLPTCANFSDTEFSRLQRLLTPVVGEEPPAPPRRKRRPPRVLVILDADVVRRRLRALGLSAQDVAKRSHVCVWEPELLVDYGELTLRNAERLARELGVPLEAITLGTRTA